MKKLPVLYIAFVLCFFIFLSGCSLVRSFTQSQSAVPPPTDPNVPSTIKNPDDLIGVEYQIKQNVIDAIRELEKLPFVEYAGPSYISHTNYDISNEL